MLNCVKNIGRNTKIGIFLSSTVLIILSVSVKWIIVPNVVKYIVWDYMKLEEGTLGYDVWKSPPVPVYMKFHLFNVTNPDDVVSGVKPRVEEVGPFVYREWREKRNIRRLGDTLNYGLHTRYSYEPDLSCDHCTPDTVLTVPNAPLLAIIGLLESFPLLNDDNPLFGRPVEAVLNLINDNIKDGDYKVATRVKQTHFEDNSSGFCFSPCQG